MQSLIQSLKKINLFLHGGNSEALKKHLKYYDRKRSEMNKNFHFLSIDLPEIKEEIEAILTVLMIPKRYWGRYFGSNLTVYDLFLELSKENHIQISYIIELLDEQEKKRRWNLIFGGLFIGSMVAGLLSLPLFSVVVTAIQAFIASPIGIPILGCLFNLGVGVYYFYNNQFDKKKSLLNRLRDHFFLFANTALTLIGYGIWIGTTSAMTPLIAGLFIAASAVDVIREVVCLGQELIHYKNNPPDPDDDNLNVQRAYIRHSIGYQKHRNAALINLVAAVVLVGIMTAWCFAPGGIFLVMGAAAAIAVVYSARFLLLRKNEEVMRERLQNELRNLETKPTYVPGMGYEMVELFSLPNEKEQTVSKELTVSPPKHIKNIPENTSLSSLSFFAASSDSIPLLSDSQLSLQ